MFRCLSRLAAYLHQKRVTHLMQQARELDELLIAGKLSPETRTVLQEQRERLESKIREQVAVC